ncbi:MAG: hypothetical protein ACRD2T_01885 [Thermoanaerobaculia bacterium]
MRFWDSSALLAIALGEAPQERLQYLLRTDDKYAIWWTTRVECEGGVARAAASGRLRAGGKRQARTFLDELYAGALEIEPSAAVRSLALHLVGVHPLRAADALQLAAALFWCQEQTAGVPFVCLDDRLREAALKEGFRVLPYADEVQEP